MGAILFGAFGLFFEPLGRPNFGALLRLIVGVRGGRGADRKEGRGGRAGEVAMGWMQRRSYARTQAHKLCYCVKKGVNQSLKGAMLAVWWGMSQGINPETKTKTN